MPSASFTTKPECPLAAVLKLMTSNPAQIINLKDRGSLTIGHHADLVLFDPFAEWTYNAAASLSKSKNSPFDQTPMLGQIHTTISEGRSRVFAAVKAPDDGRVRGLDWGHRASELSTVNSVKTSARTRTSGNVCCRREDEPYRKLGPTDRFVAVYQHPEILIVSLEYRPSMLGSPIWRRILKIEVAAIRLRRLATRDVRPP